MKTKNTFNDYRFAGFHYQSYSPKYWVFTSQINDDESKVLIRIAANRIFSYEDHDGKTHYVLKLDQTHCAFFKEWEYFKGLYGNYLLIDHKRYHAVKSTKRFIELDLHSDMLTFASAIVLAKHQEHNQHKKHKAIMIHKD